MKGLVSVLLMACFAIALLVGTSDNANGQNCNVQQTQQNSAAAALQQAEINRLAVQGAQLNQPQFFTQSGGTSASASSATASPSVAQLRAAAAPRFFAQSVPVASSGGSAASASAVAPSNQIVAQDVGTCNVNASGGGGGGGHGGLLSRLKLPRTQTTRSVAITRVSSR